MPKEKAKEAVMRKLYLTHLFFPWLWFLLDAIISLGEPFTFAAGKCLCSEFIETGSEGQGLD